ncbi:glutathione S-transferase N-terminal domain-containing protein [Maricaulis sp.]|uniref:glutathione S-transferase N-terminal domain-containing protein n=1 Tax=Maricaulis sp. TaxID=1486257 RepID=UPI00261956A8|nr:glutathione S-transferase N-terminal domain-containing protein [Maricaulis sp.]
MKLLVSDTSPYARKCRILVHELGLGDRVEEVDAHPFQDGEILLEANPLGRVLALIMDDGRALTESLLIGTYLAAQADQPWGEDWDEWRLQTLGSGLIDLAVGRRVEMVRDEALYSDYWIGRRERGIARALDQLEPEAAGLSQPLGFAGLTIAVALDYLDFRYPEANWREARPHLIALHGFWSQRESFAVTRPPADA